MKIEQELLRQVRSAKTDNNAADELIRKYMPFIKAETAKFLKRPPVEGHDDELSIALIAFHEAIESYEDRRGAFLPYAGMLIRSRLLDYARSQQRHSGILSLDRSDDPEEDGALMDTVAAPGITARNLPCGRPPAARFWSLPPSCSSLAYLWRMWRTTVPSKAAPWRPAARRCSTPGATGR